MTSMADLHEYDMELLRRSGSKYLIGMDEAGRGPLAGPVVVAYVVLDPKDPIVGLNDSKKLTDKKRKKLFVEVSQRAVYKRVMAGNVNLIESVNIRQATIKTMERCLEDLDLNNKIIAIDGDLVLPSYPQESQQCIVKGDAKSAAIGAASILAKVSRDILMEQYSRVYPEYCFEKHKGYGTALHIQKIKEHGLCPIHRSSFCSRFV